MGFGIHLSDYERGHFEDYSYINFYKFEELKKLARKAKRVCGYIVSKTYYGYDGLTPKIYGNKVRYHNFEEFTRLIEYEERRLFNKKIYSNPYIYTKLLDRRYSWEIVPAVEMIEVLQKRLETCEKRAQSSRRKLNLELSEIEEFTRRWKGNDD